MALFHSTPFVLFTVFWSYWKYGQFWLDLTDYANAATNSALERGQAISTSISVVKSLPLLRSSLQRVVLTLGSPQWHGNFLRDRVA